VWMYQMLWDREKEACHKEGESNPRDCKERIKVSTKMENEL